MFTQNIELKKHCPWARIETTPFNRISIAFPLCHARLMTADIPNASTLLTSTLFLHKVSERLIGVVVTFKSVNHIECQRSFVWVHITGTETSQNKKIQRKPKSNLCWKIIPQVNNIIHYYLYLSDAAETGGGCCRPIGLERKGKRIWKGFGFKNSQPFVQSTFIGNVYLHARKPKHSNNPREREREKAVSLFEFWLRLDPSGIRRSFRGERPLQCYVFALLIGFSSANSAAILPFLTHALSLLLLDIVSYYLLILPEFVPPSAWLAYRNWNLTASEVSVAFNLSLSGKRNTVVSTNKFTFWQISHGAWLDLKRWRRTAGEVFPLSVVVEQCTYRICLRFFCLPSDDANGAGFVYAHAETDIHVFCQLEFFTMRSLTISSVANGLTELRNYLRLTECFNLKRWLW